MITVRLLAAAFVAVLAIQLTVAIPNEDPRTLGQQYYTGGQYVGNNMNYYSPQVAQPTRPPPNHVGNSKF